MSVSLESILRLVQPTCDAELITGDLRTQVSGVVGILAGDDVGRLARAGDLVVVLDGTPAPGWPLDAFLRRCGDVSVAAIAVPSDALDGGSLSVAERLGVPVIRSPDSWRLSVAVHELLHAPVNAQIGALTKSLAPVLQAPGTELESLLRAASEVTGLEFLLLDTKGRGLLSEVHWSAADQAVVELPLPKSTLSFDSVLPSGIRLIARRVELTGRDVWLGLTLPGEDLSAAEVAGYGLAAVQAVAAQRLAAMEMVHERDSRTRTALLSELTEAGPEPSEDLLRRTLAAGWEIRGWHVGLRIIALGEGATISLREDLLEAFARQGLGLRAVEQTDGWVAWLSYAVEPTRAIEPISAAIRRAQRSFQAVLPTAVGVGSLLPGAGGLVKSLGQATDAARIALTRPASGHFVHVDRLGLAQLLLALTHTDVFTPAARGLLDPLGDPNGLLVATLSAYLDSGGSQAETAAVLGIHRNTVAQRMAQIRRVLAVDLADPETRLALHLACRAVRVATQES